MVHFLSVPDSGKDFRFFSDPFRWKEHKHGFADCFLRRIAEKVFRATIPTGDPALQGLADDRFFGGLDDRCQSSAHFLRLLTLGNIIDQHQFRASPEPFQLV